MRILPLHAGTASELTRQFVNQDFRISTGYDRMTRYEFRSALL